MESLEHSLSLWGSILQLTLEGISLFCVLLGLLSTIHIIFTQNRRRRLSSSAMSNIRLNFGRWLSVALEFQLGSDIVNTTIAPSFEDLAKLGTIAIIRTFLNYFLSRELAEETAAPNQEYKPTP